MGAQPADGGIVADSGFRDDRFSFWDMASEALGSSQVDAEIVEVAVIDTDDVAT